jgi:predicted SAM-dependent methyltransferase
MEHVKDDLKCMKELHRILKPNGWGLIQVPIDSSRCETYEDWSITDPKEREKHFWQYDHVRLYGLNYPRRLEEAGFNVEVIDFSKELPAETFERYRIPKLELLYIVHKS